VDYDQGRYFFTEEREIERQNKWIWQPCLVVVAIKCGVDEDRAVVANGLDDLHGYLGSDYFALRPFPNRVNAPELPLDVIYKGIPGKGGQKSLGIMPVGCRDE
jgi:hypothetical protein